MSGSLIPFGISGCDDWLVGIYLSETIVLPGSDCCDDWLVGINLSETIVLPE